MSSEVNVSKKYISLWMYLYYQTPQYLSSKRQPCDSFKLVPRLNWNGYLNKLYSSLQYPVLKIRLPDIRKIVQRRFLLRQVVSTPQFEQNIVVPSEIVILWVSVTTVKFHVISELVYFGLFSFMPHYFPNLTLARSKFSHNIQCSQTVMALFSQYDDELSLLLYILVPFTSFTISTNHCHQT